MKKTFSFAAPARALLKITFILAFFIFLVTGCQRDMEGAPAKAEKSKMRDDLLTLMKERGSSFYIPINKTVPGVLLDENGNEIITGLKKNTGLMRQTPDEFCEDPSSAVVGPNTLEGVSNQITDCENVVHTLTVYYEIKSSFDLAPANPGNPAQTSKGKIRIKNGATVIFSDANIPINVADIDYIDTDGDGLKRYKVSFQRANIPHSNFTAGAFTSVEVAIAIYTDCTDPYDAYPINIGYVAAFTPSMGLEACNRIDQVYINPAVPGNPPGHADYCGAIGGSYVTGSPGDCQGGTYNLGCQVQVKKAGDPDGNYVSLQTWDIGKTDFRTTGYVYNWEFRQMRQLQDYVPNASTITFPASFTFRWRNFDGTGVGSISCFSSYWSIPETLTIHDFPPIP